MPNVVRDDLTDKLLSIPYLHRISLLLVSSSQPYISFFLGPNAFDFLLNSKLLCKPLIWMQIFRFWHAAAP